MEAADVLEEACEDEVPFFYAFQPQVTPAENIGEFERWVVGTFIFGRSSSSLFRMENRGNIALNISRVAVNFVKL